MRKYCSHCNFEFTRKMSKCPECGASFLAASNSPKQEGNFDVHPLVQLLFYQPKKKADKYIIPGRYFAISLIALLTFFIFLNSVQSSVVLFFHNVNLPFHEAGHIVFSLFGNALLTSMGGTLLQFIMPLVCMFTFLFQNRDPFAAAIALWWVGENFVDIAPYIADARAGVLPLLGGNTGQSAPYGFHDWEFILGELGLSHLDLAISYLSQIFGIIVMIAAVVWALYELVNLRRLTYEDW